ncbi:sulfotransferase family 2 domain-containing protein [Ekhidna sp.]|uniref:sulfotransferase family 2 domain-containing protein n=1 Tax=Ekhidna sp. TaxID=2608089 RepID=UPI003513381E
MVFRSRFLSSIVPELFNERLNRSSVYKNFYDRNETIFIHTPKTGGTSVSKLMYGDDPWHYSACELSLINPEKFKRYRKVGFVRNPFDRLVSTYYYGQEWIKVHPTTSLKFLSEFNSFEHFIESGLNRRLVANHYFFWPYTKYLFINKKLPMDEVGRFENLANEVNRIFDLPMDKIPFENKSSIKRNYKEYYSPSTVKKINQLYQSDLRNFDYDF